MAELMQSSVEQEEYQTQLFEFPPSSFFEEVKGTISERLCEGLDQLEEQLKKVPNSILSEEEVVQGISQLRQHIDSNFQKTIHKLECLVIGTLMKIPSHILLPSDVEQEMLVSFSDIALLQTEIDSLQAQLKNEKYMQARDRDELLEIGEVLKQQQKLKDCTLSSQQIKCAEDIQEELLFIQCNETDNKFAKSKAKEAFLNISQTCSKDPFSVFYKSIIQ